MLAYWTMWLKRNHPQEFYTASLAKYGEKKQLELLRDASIKKGLKVYPPDPGVSGLTWQTQWTDGIRAGLMQIPRIGPTVAERIVEWRKAKGGNLAVGGWYDLLEIPGIGIKTVERIMEFVAQDDPFGIYKMHRMLEAVRDQIAAGTLPLPYPTHTSLEVPYERGADEEVVWLGQIIHRNLRELFELHYSRTGEQLNPKEVKDPDLNEWVVMVGVDEDEFLTITVPRWKYRNFKSAIWGIQLEHDVVLVRGIKKGSQARRAIYVKEMWVLDPDDD
jgi:hypothetical protein